MQFIAATHTLDSSETAGYPAYNDNDSFNSADGEVRLIRGMLLMASGARAGLLGYVASNSETSYISAYGASHADDASIKSYDDTSDEGVFRLFISSSIGSNFGNDEGHAGIKIYKTSLDPNSDFYISKVLNTNPDDFHSK